MVQLHKVVLGSITTDRIIIPERHELRAAIDFDEFTTLEDYYVQQYHASNRPAEPNKHAISQLSQCRCIPNPNTNHIRLPAVKILNMSMVPANDFGPEYASYKYFNPAIIPLPSHVYTTSGYRYLLVSRLVTTGHHQESHICFADICSPDTFSSHNTKSCTESDLDWLGPQGGLRCITKPAKVNIPPTPSRRCTGAWSTFPDIPGFHDPRIFWSGRGEPLIEVNSGSQYGCVGLWLQDLRAVYPLLDEVLGKREKGLVSRDASNGADDAVGQQAMLNLLGLGPPIVYPHLTEITKNPRSSRSEVEKNWVLFFPTEDETWVQYDMMGKTGSDEERAEEKLSGVTTTAIEEMARETLSVEAVQPITPIQGPATKTLKEETEEAISTEVNSEIEPPSDPDLRASPAAPTSTATEIDISDTKDDQELKAVLFEEGPAKREETQKDDSNFQVELLASSLEVDTAEKLQSSSQTQASDSMASIMLNNHPIDAIIITSSTTLDTSSNPQSSTSSMKAKTFSTGGRSLAQLLSHGHTTPNLTSPLESPCFNLADHAHIHDKYNNTGHWHQGSNSLRLILCTREQFRTRSCIQSTDLEARTQEFLSWEVYEGLLVNEGLVVHFSIVHRKFNNDWDLPMRYERYFLVWETRKPFRTLGISQYPILFGEERSRPWSEKEGLSDGSDGGSGELERRDEEVDEALGDGSGKEDQHESVYFTYTPSIAWAWRPNSDEGATQERGHEDLGTGYLGEDIVIGIGMDDVAQGFVEVKVDEVLTCLRMCPV